MELSIVLVILGLLTGGILAGQSLIRAAELRSVVTDYQRYSTAKQTFRDKYVALPGDMANATRFWGDDSAACSDTTITNGSPGTCNGDGDGIVYDGTSGAGNVTAEQFQFWKQLSLAGLIEGTYSGLAGTVANRDHDRGVNCPAGRINKSLWGSTFFNNSSPSTSSGHFAIDFRNALVFGSDDDNSRADGPTIKIEEVWNIDKKLDDGKPGSGFVICGWVTGCVTSGSNTDFTGEYNLASTATTWVVFLPR